MYYLTLFFSENSEKKSVATKLEGVAGLLKNNFFNGFPIHYIDFIRRHLLDMVLQCTMRTCGGVLCNFICLLFTTSVFSICLPKKRISNSPTSSWNIINKTPYIRKKNPLSNLTHLIKLPKFENFQRLQNFEWRAFKCIMFDFSV